MPKMKFSIILPVAQVAVAIGLLEWGQRVTPPKFLDTLYVATPTLVCMGINAPAQLMAMFALLLIPVRWTYIGFLGFPLPHWFFLGGVIIVWSLLGRWFDKYKSLKEFSNRNVCGSKIVLDVLMLILSGALLMVSWIVTRSIEGNNRCGLYIEDSLNKLWITAMAAVSGMGIAKRMLPGLWKSRSPDEN